MLKRYVALNEFDLINTYFKTDKVTRDDVILGIGDDAALLSPPKDQQLVSTMDTLIEGVHFSKTISPADLGYRSLAVNLSDLASMGATPAWVMLALTIPSIDENWLAEFSKGFFHLAKKYNIVLVGGDTTQGELSITVQATGFVPERKAVKRSTAKVGDLIGVTGNLGDAGLAFELLSKNKIVPDICLEKLNRPIAKVEEGVLLRSYVSAMVDISDGLAADLQHILKQSQVGADIFLENLPISTTVKNSVNVEDAFRLALSAGDDYELCFTVSPEHKHILQNRLPACYFIGEIKEGSKLKLIDKKAEIFELNKLGYQHFG